MRNPPRIPGRPQSRREEFVNSLSHSLGFVAALIAAPVLILQAFERGDIGVIIGASLFALSMVLLYLASSLYHAMRPGRAKRLMRMIEHSAIYLLIAGTYSPFMLGVLNGPGGWILLTVIWLLAGTGVALKLTRRLSRPTLSTGLYVLMGWLIVLMIQPLSEALSDSGLAWLIGGGLAYTVGVLFFVLDSSLLYGHFIWHLFVMAGTTCHYFAVLWHAF
ncbi:PAQR family membrane homeostasis protein TrhA [Marinobacterium rhizophilum]|uniref:Hemolysin III family protein n=1 Tax=Marinobacterium rhizophilum TaxID=420402 RepID=A0ABY5HHT6_9GAMM|nr:hemolysin III family protein [Marinobacterium rhizophilum]UTW11925.1 hemolysin III family protein [Marinobacterium rhizophilum]